MDDYFDARIKLEELLSAIRNARQVDYAKLTGQPSLAGLFNVACLELDHLIANLRSGLFAKH